ncbi:MAG: 2-C-methyl-D-erythritol 4-phosphate cytidylyltransferase [Clostridia bacterium]|nr:2-C-methyl-D-erythritol 4-phosphate cytidylyltransferase [Clostridia bacterium]
MGAPLNKVFLPLGGRPLLLYSVRLFEESPFISTYVVVAAPEEVGFCRTLLSSCSPDKLAGVVAGGETRQESVANGLRALSEDCSFVVVHDGARPLLSRDVLEGAVQRAFDCGAVVVGVPVKDTVKVVEQGGVTATPPRSSLWIAQTPQVFRRSLLSRALEAAGEAGFQGSDDSSLVERLGVRVEMFRGGYENIKITTPGDLVIAESLLAGAKGAAGEAQERGEVGSRIGLGYDVHPFCAGRPLILGGVEIPGETGLAGHSDADVLLHALMDACLGAAGLPDIGSQFPPGEPRWKDASSLALLAVVAGLLDEAGYRVAQVDLVVAAERPRLGRYLEGMKERIAAVLGIPRTAVGLKATTTEGLGFVGRGEGIAAWAVATVMPKKIRPPSPGGRG